MNFVQARHNMVNQQVRTWGVFDRRVLETLLQIPREAFVPEAYRALAYADMPIPLGAGEYLFKPVVEARLLQALAIQTSDTVLEIGTGSGYLTACLARLAAYVHSVERSAQWATAAQHRLAAQEITNVAITQEEVREAWEPDAHFDVIVLGGSCPEYLTHWQDHLKLGGRLFVVVGNPPIMTARLVTRTGEQSWQTQDLFETVIPPLYHTAKAPEFVL